jgi:site-specific recombinase XerD
MCSSKVERFELPAEAHEGYTKEELERILAFNQDCERYSEIRDRALLWVYAASGLRHVEVLNIQLGDYDKITGQAAAANMPKWAPV